MSRQWRTRRCHLLWCIFACCQTLNVIWRTHRHTRAHTQAQGEASYTSDESVWRLRKLNYWCALGTKSQTLPTGRPSMRTHFRLNPQMLLNAAKKFYRKFYGRINCARCRNETKHAFARKEKNFSNKLIHANLVFSFSCCVRTVDCEVNWWWSLQ